MKKFALVLAALAVAVVLLATRHSSQPDAREPASTRSPSPAAAETPSMTEYTSSDGAVHLLYPSDMKPVEPGVNTNIVFSMENADGLVTVYANTEFSPRTAMANVSKLLEKQGFSLEPSTTQDTTSGAPIMSVSATGEADGREVRIKDFFTTSGDGKTTYTVMVAGPTDSFAPGGASNAIAMSVGHA